MDWIMRGQKLGAEQHAAPAGPRHLQLDAASLANELNGCPAARCGSPDHVVPEACPASPDSTLEAERSPAWATPWDAEAVQPSTPQTPEPASSNVAALRKRNLQTYEAMPIQPRTHRRKSLHPMRAAEAVADDWETRASPVRASPPRTIRKHEAHSRHSPERIHRKQTHAAKAVRNTAAAPDGSTVAKECHDCHTLKTPMWRRVEGVTYCNACGLRRTRALVGR
jgi:hypothetical protein